MTVLLFWKSLSWRESLSQRFLKVGFIVLLHFQVVFMSIYVGNLSFQVTEEDITEVFAEYGAVKRVQVPTDRETGRMRGFAFVDMSSDAEEDAAIEALDGAEWMGRALKVNKAKPREDRRPGGGGGNRGQSRRYWTVAIQWLMQ